MMCFTGCPFSPPRALMDFTQSCPPWTIGRATLAGGPLQLHMVTRTTGDFVAPAGGPAPGTGPAVAPAGPPVPPVPWPACVPPGAGWLAGAAGDAWPEGAARPGSRVRPVPEG